MWSDDDWLKKFSGKTTEEAEEGAEPAGEDANTTTQEVKTTRKKRQAVVGVGFNKMQY